MRRAHNLGSNIFNVFEQILRRLSRGLVVFVCLYVLGAREHDEVADGDIARTRQHEDDGIGDIFGAKAFAGSGATLDLCRIPDAPEFIEHYSGRHRSDPDASLQQLPAESVHKRLNGMLGSTVNRFPVNGLVPGNGTRHYDITRSALDQMRQGGMDQSKYA
jgi:hypothetical protein